MPDHRFTTAFAVDRSPAEANAGPAATTRVGTAAFTATLGLAAASWVVAVWQMNGMDMGAATELGSFGFFAALWVSMMTAMMLPSAAPAVVRHVRAGRRVLAGALFVCSYLAVWALVGAAVYAVYRPHGAVAAAVVVIAAGVYELTPLKRHFRRRCRESVRSGFEFGPLLRRLEHRTNADAGRAGRHERRLDGGNHRRRFRPEALARKSRCRRAAGARDRRARHLDRHRTRVSSRTHPNDVKEKMNDHSQAPELVKSGSRPGWTCS